MSTIRVAKRKRFTTISRETLNDGRLSFRARGILVWLLDKPDDWTTSADAIASQGLEGRDAVRTALTELESCGYLIRNKDRDKKTGVWTTKWVVHEVPPGRISSAGKPQRVTSAGEPTLDNQASNTEDMTLTTDLCEEDDFGAPPPPKVARVLSVARDPEVLLAGVTQARAALKQETA